MPPADTKATPAPQAPQLAPSGTGLRVSVWIEPGAAGDWDMVLTCTNRDVAPRRLTFNTERLANEALAPCSMRFMDDIKRAETGAPDAPTLI